MDPLRPFQPTSTPPTWARLPAQSEEESQEGPPDQFFDSPASDEDLTPEEEFAEGERHERELLEKYPEWADAGARRLLDDCYEYLRPTFGRDDLSYRFVALDTPKPLASSCPNGTVFFSRGLLGQLSFGQVCYFGAHEIAHSELRHYATRMRRLSQLQQAIPAPAGTALRIRLDQAAVVAVRHQEEFEADHQAALWLNFELAESSLRELARLCQRLDPESISKPSHPSWDRRLSHIVAGDGPPELLSYCYALLA